MKTELDIRNKKAELESQLYILESKWWKTRKNKIFITFIKKDIAFIEKCLRLPSYTEEIKESFLNSEKRHLERMLPFFESMSIKYRSNKDIPVKIECTKNHIAFLNWCLK